MRCFITLMRDDWSSTGYEYEIGQVHGPISALRALASRMYGLSGEGTWLHARGISHFWIDWQDRTTQRVYASTLDDMPEDKCAVAFDVDCSGRVAWWDQPVQDTSMVWRRHRLWLL